MSRDGPPSPTDDDMRIEPAGSQSPDIGLQNSRRRGLSEAQQLLTGSERNSFEVEVTKAFRYVAAPVMDDSDRRGSEDAVGGYPQTLKPGGRNFGKDFVMVLVTLPFFGLAGGVIHFDGELVTEYFENLMDNCTKVVSKFRDAEFLN